MGGLAQKLSGFEELRGRQAGLGTGYRHAVLVPIAKRSSALPKISTCNAISEIGHTLDSLRGETTLQPVFDFNQYRHRIANGYKAKRPGKARLDR